VCDLLLFVLYRVYVEFWKLCVRMAALYWNHIWNTF